MVLWCPSTGHDGSVVWNTQTHFITRWSARRHHQSTPITNTIVNVPVSAVHLASSICLPTPAVYQVPNPAVPNPTGISGASYYEGSFSNISRSPAGDYVAVSSRGNFFMTWTPGQEYWQPHNRWE